jgi:hypothetical protein
LDDRLAFVGNTGSGKTYSSGTAIERLLANSARVVIPDPLGVWWGLALDGNGKAPSRFRKSERLVIFGGESGDLPLTEHAGALIGETVAGMTQSCILDMSGLGTKAAERRFMLAFLTALYKHKTPDPLHVVFDEADMWAPQRVLDKEGEAMKLLGMMETICRRGRVKGFIPWLITQRPAVLSKNVLSQVDGLVAFKLTSVHDRDAIGDWVEGQADTAQWKGMWADMARLDRGQGLVWLPARGILKTEQFPRKVTFDSSRTPGRGERPISAAALQPVNIDKLKERLAKVEQESKASDPKALRAEIARLQRELTSKSTQAASPGALQAADKAGFDRGYLEGIAAGRQHIVGVVEDIRKDVERHRAEARRLADKAWDERVPPRAAPTVVPQTPPRAKAATPSGNGTLDRSLQKIVDAIRWWNVLGVSAPSHPQVAFVASYSHKSGTWATYLSRLRSSGLIEGRGDLVLTSAGSAVANEPGTPPTGEHLRVTVLEKLDVPLVKILGPIINAYPGALSHQEAADAAGYSHTSGTWATYLSRLRSLDLIEGRGELKAQPWLFPVRIAA